MISDKKCPCEECVSFAICNSTIKDMTVPTIANLSTTRGCNELLEFIHMNKKGYVYVHSNKREINIARRLFGLKLLKQRHFQQRGIQNE